MTPTNSELTCLREEIIQYLDGGPGLGANL
jgi:hypothetical protein